MDLIIRAWQESDDLSEITRLLNAAYAELAEMGFRYMATWQGDAETRQRLVQGHALMAIVDDEIVGTATLYLAQPDSQCEWYRRADAAHFGQFGVKPGWQRQGIGSALLDRIEETALTIPEVEYLALDTAEGATHLIQLYQKRGYDIVDKADWEVTNYQSVIMAKPASSILLKNL